MAQTCPASGDARLHVLYATSAKGDARLHVPTTSPLETHVSSQSRALPEEAETHVSKSQAEKLPQFTDSNCKAPPINRTCYLSPNCLISCQRSAAEIVPRTAFHYSVFI